MGIYVLVKAVTLHANHVSISPLPDPRTRRTYFPSVVIVFIGFIIFLFIISITKGIKNWSSNNVAQELFEECTAVTKRTEVWGAAEI
jgi:hypothetical protein